jgi:transcription elongation factor Elf1
MSALRACWDCGLIYNAHADALVDLNDTVYSWVDLLIRRRECVGLAFDNVRTYSKHLTAESENVLCRLANTVGTVFNDVSMNMA